VSERFVKYHGLGNDFVVVDRRASGVDVTPAEATAWCDRHLGIGADGVLAILPSARAAARMVVHNADGSIAQMCGNGLRCVVKHVGEGQEQQAMLDIETGAGVLQSSLHWSDHHVDEVTVAMGPAMLDDTNLPTPRPFVRQRLQGRVGTAVSMGNPHFVLLDTPVGEAAALGPLLERDSAFPQRANIEFVELHGVELRVVVWERGVGLTQACGTGACAAVAAWGLEGRVPFEAWVRVLLPGGSLQIRVGEDLQRVSMRGPVRRVFEGVLPKLAA
jgi:diaminopimelate epimerase